MTETNFTNTVNTPPHTNVTVMPWTPPPATALLLSSIIEVARDNNADIDKITQLIALHDRMKLSAEEEAFDAAMNAAQSEMGRVATDSNNPQTHSKYASYGALDRAVRPIYTKHGFSLMFDTQQAPTPDAVLVTCRVSRGGAHRIFSIAMPADGKGARGNDVMSKTHATGSAVSYGRRYLLGMIFNLATGQDDDGVAASGGPRLQHSNTYTYTNTPRKPVAAPNVLRAPMPAHDPQTGEIHEPVQESVSTPTADPENSSAPTGLEYGAEENLTDRITRLDKDLGVAAARGMAALKEAWDKIDEDNQQVLRAALNKRHKIKAAEADKAAATP